MIQIGVAKRYATALFNAAEKTGQITEIQDELQGLKTLFASNPEFRKFLLSPKITIVAKKDVIETSFGDRSTELFVRFVDLVIDKKRVFHMDNMIDAYNYMWERHEGIIEAHVETAVPLDERMTEKVREKIIAETGLKPSIITKVDPDIIGGIVIRMDGKIIDASIRYYLEKLRRDLDDIRVI